VPDAAVIAVALADLEAARNSKDPWQRLVGWRHGDPAWTRREFDVLGRGRVEVLVAPRERTWMVRFDELEPTTALFDVEPDGRWRLVVNGRVCHLTAHLVGRTVHVALDGTSWPITEVDQRGAGGDRAVGHGDGTVRSPMPGTVITVEVAIGDAVSHGQAVAIVEAMKMEHTLTAPFDGIVGEVHTSAGASVALDQPIVTIAPVAAGDG
jgi:acetyl-CoA/propionyl-CoA carboxylase biotin carboxyl carrier protein